MKILLLALNARYIHSNPALFLLEKMIRGEKREIVQKQWSINTPREKILEDIFDQKPDIIGFSSYIWNISFLEMLAEEVSKILPETILIFGGPQATGEKEALLNRAPAVSGLVIGEGEEVFPALIAALERGEKKPSLPGILWHGAEGCVEAGLPDMKDLPFPYTKEELALATMQGKTIYYEASRGCPYGCIFCFSAHQPLRERPLSMVKEDISFLAENFKGQIKLVDRTFNADCKRALEISEYLLQLYTPDISWHLEISPYNLQEPLLELWKNAPPDYFRLEAGVQSLNENVLKTIHRRGDWQKAKKAVEKIMEKDNLRLHLDLLAGLPEETMESFEHAFNEVHQLLPHYLQLGFLKVLPGSLLANDTEKIGIVSSPYPPYRVLYTANLSPLDLFSLQRIEEGLDEFYNIGRFRQTLYYAGLYWPGGAMSFYHALGDIKKAYGEDGLSLKTKAEILWRLLAELPQKELFYDLLLLDWCIYGKGETIPGIFKDNIEYTKGKFKELILHLDHQIEFIPGARVKVEEGESCYYIDQNRRIGISNRANYRKI